MTLSVPFRTAAISSASISRAHFHRHMSMIGHKEKIEVQNFKLYFEQTGSGPHPIICLPGALGSVETDFRPQLTHLNKDLFTIVSWDPPGFGKSRPPNREFSQGIQIFQRDARLADSLMNKLGFVKYSVLGWSDGGITGLLLTALCPDSVERLVVWGGRAFVAQTDIDTYKKVQNIDNWSPNMQAPMIKEYGEPFFRQTWSNWVEFYVGILAEGGDIIGKREIETIGCPTLIIHGRKDPMVGISHPEYIHRHIKNSKFVIMEEGKHNLHLRYYKEFNRLVEDFLTSNKDSVRS